MAKKQAPKDPILVKLGQRIVELREKTGLKKNEIFYEHGFDGSRLNRIEKGEINITIRTLYDLSKILNITPSDMIKGLVE